MASTTYINNIEITNGSNTTSYLIEPTLFGVATTADEGTTYTLVGLSGFTLIYGATIQVLFNHTNKINPTLNINATGARFLHYNNSSLAANIIKANHIYTLVYNDMYWQIVGDIDTNTWRPLGTGATDAAAGDHTHGNITNDGKMFGSTASGTTTTSHLFLREDGTWAVPAYAVSANTHRPIEMNGTQILGDNVTPLNLVAGSHISLTNSSGAVTITNTMTAADLGLSSALRFKGITTSTMSEDFTGVPQGITGYTTPQIGDVVLDHDNNGEYVCIDIITQDNTTAYTWEWLGAEGSFKLVQTAVSDPTASSDTSTSFIDSISQNTQGVITATKKILPTASTSVAGIIKIGDTANDAAAGNHTHLYAGSSTVGGGATTVTINTVTGSTGTKGYFTYVAATAGDNSLTAQDSIYVYNTMANNVPTSVYLNIGKNQIQGGLTLHSATNADAYGNLIPTTLTANTARTWTLPDATGTIALTTDTIYAATNDSDGNPINTTYVKKVSSTDNAIVRFDGTDGAVQNSTSIITDDGVLCINSNVTENTHKLLVNGDSAFNGKLAFIGAVANTLTETAAIAYDSVNASINFRIGTSDSVASTIKISSTALYHATTNVGTLGTSTNKWKELYLEAQSTDNTSGIMFYTTTNLRGRIWANTLGGLGIYGIDNLYFKTSLTDETNGMQLSTTNLYPSTNNGIDLGSTTNEWKFTYSKKFIVEQHVTLEWNATDLSLDFIFA